MHSPILELLTTSSPLPLPQETTQISASDGLSTISIRTEGHSISLALWMVGISLSTPVLPRMCPVLRFTLFNVKKVDRDTHCKKRMGSILTSSWMVLFPLIVHGLVTLYLVLRKALRDKDCRQFNTYTRFTLLISFRSRFSYSFALSNTWISFMTSSQAIYSRSQEEKFIINKHSLAGTLTRTNHEPYAFRTRLQPRSSKVSYIVNVVSCSLVQFKCGPFLRFRSIIPIVLAKYSSNEE
jgi:hypothetical protein